MITEKIIYMNHNKNIDLDCLPSTRFILDTGRWYIHRPKRSCQIVFPVARPPIWFREGKNTPAKPSVTAAKHIHYPQAPEGKTALNDCLVMTIGGTRYTVKSIFSQNGGDFREMLEAAVVSRAARCLSAGGAAPEADTPQAVASAGQGA